MDDIFDGRYGPSVPIWEIPPPWPPICPDPAKLGGGKYEDDVVMELGGGLF